MPSYSDNNFDRHVNTDLMRVCKCVIPYLDRDTQKTVAIGLKIVELINTINIYNDENIIGEMSLTRGDHWESDLLQSVRSNLSPEKAYLIDAVLKLKEVRSIMNATKSDSMPPPFPNPTSCESDYQPSFYTDNAPPFQSSFYTDDAPSSRTDPEPSPSPVPPPKSPNTSGPSPASLIQAVAPLLDDNQKQLLNLFAGFLK